VDLAPAVGSQVGSQVKVHGVIVAKRRRAHYLVIITVDPYIPSYIIVHEWIYILTQMQECLDNKSTTSLKFQGSKSLLPPPLNL